jgi:hypothetical protein
VTEFRPLLESSTSATARELLRSGLDDAPPPESMGRVAGVLGLTLTAAVVAAPAGAATVNGALASGLGAVGKTSGISAALVGKWLASGLVAGALVSGTASVVERVNQPPRTSEHVVVRAPTAPRAPSPGRSTASPLPETAESRESEAVVTTTPTAIAVASVASTTPPVPDSSASRALGAEAARIDAARRALEQGDARRALIELDWYERSRIVGVLDREAALLRIQALVRMGDKARAVEVARGYLAKHPQDAYAARLHELIRAEGATFPIGDGKAR